MSEVGLIVFLVLILLILSKGNKGKGSGTLELPLGDISKLKTTPTDPERFE